MLGCLLLAVGMSAAAHAEVVYVNAANAGGTQNGASWATAYSTIEAALQASAIYQDAEVWVAQGTYGEERSDPTGALRMKSNVTVYGGFSGSETSLSEQNWTAHETIIDGSTARDGQPAMHVLIASNATLDGVTISGGQATGLETDGLGGGVIVYGPTARFRNCTFRNNHALDGGAVGMTKGAVARFYNCRFEDNTAQSGGAIAADARVITGATTATATNLYIEDCGFETNTAASKGGALSIESLDAVWVLSSTFNSNQGNKGGACAFNETHAWVRDSTFEANIVVPIEEGLPVPEGGALYATNSILNARRSAFSANDADNGGAAYVFDGDALFYSCTFMENTADWGGAVFEQEPLSPEVKTPDTQPVFINCLLAKNSATAGGGALYTEGGVTLTQSTVADNSDPSPAIAALALIGVNNAIWDDTQPLPGGVWGLTFTMIRGGADGLGNVDDNPRFTDALNGDYTLRDLSRAVNNGTPLLLSDPALNGVWRPSGNAFDMGAYERPIMPDTDGDGISDGLEGAFDSDGDGSPDYLDLDSDHDGALDAQEGPADYDGDALGSHRDPDSDGDGISDALEVPAGLDPSDPEDAALDLDNDGLTALQELALHGSHPLYTDTDMDGMPDGYEVEHALDPAVFDAYLDADGDGLPNAHEWQIATNPNDPADPQNDLYVAPDGSDDNAGTADSRLATLTRAMTVARLYSAAEFYGVDASPVTVHVAAGVYDEQVIVPPAVTLSGDGQEATIIRWSGATVENSTLLALGEATRIYNCTAEFAGLHPFEVTLADMNDVSVTLEYVTLDGAGNAFATGIRALEGGSSDSVVRRSIIERVRTGLYARESGINFTRTTFRDISGDAVYVAAPVTKQSGRTVPMLGDIHTADSTLNTFRSIAGFFVSNQTRTLLEAEQSDWGIYRADDIQKKMLGPVDFKPFLSGGGQNVGCSGTGGATTGDIVVMLLVGVLTLMYRQVRRCR
jgi:predicted outer membrane repeat protein